MKSQETHGRDPHWVKYERRILIAIIANFVVFCVISVFIGGDAVNGGYNDGVFYLSAQGNDTAVDPLIWYYSRTHAQVVIGSFILMILYIISRGFVRRRLR